MIIIGAGLAGCLAGALNKDASIVEFGPKKDTHKALLRFRTNKIAEATGIQFKKVKVYKGIWHNDQSVPLTPRAIALYSRKVSDTISYRSITNIDTVDRYIAPVDFHDRLRKQCKNRIVYNAAPEDIGIEDKHPMISTLPLHVISNMLGAELNLENNTNKIYVSKFKLEYSNVYMTYYYTDPTINVYRASITGDELIIESCWEITQAEILTVLRSFGLTGIHPDCIVDNYQQPNGKIIPMDEKLRRDTVLSLTLEHNIYSLGRFATWRNLLLDDVYDDILVIKRLMNEDFYSHYKERAKL